MKQGVVAKQPILSYSYVPVSFTMAYDPSLSFDVQFARNGITDSNILKILRGIVKNQSDTYTKSQLFDICIEYAQHPYKEQRPDQSHLYMQKYKSKQAVDPDTWTDYNGHMIYNLSQNTHENVQHSVSSLPQTDPSTKLHMYHVTSWKMVACKFVQQHINVNAGRKCLDFGQTPSFYLTDSIATAIEYVERQQATYKCEVVIMIYEVDKSVTDKDDDGQLVFHEANASWRRLIKYSRQCNAAKRDEAIEGNGFIYGPMCANPEDVKYGNPPKPHRWSVKFQLAVKASGVGAMVNTSKLRHAGTIFVNKFLVGGSDDAYSKICNFTGDDMAAFFLERGWRKPRKGSYKQEEYSADWSQMHILTDILMHRFKRLSSKVTFYEKLLKIGATIAKATSIMQQLQHKDDELLRDPKRHKDLMRMVL